MDSTSSSSSMSSFHTSENQAEQSPVSSPWNPISASQSEASIVSVMGASSWPTLSEITNVPSNRIGDIPSSSTSVVSQGIATASSSVPISRDPTLGQPRQRSSRSNVTSGSANGYELPSHNTFQSQRNANGNHHQSHDRDSFRNQNGNHHHHRQGNQQNWTYHHMNFNGNVQSQRGSGAAFVRHAPPPHMQPVHQYMMMAAQPIQAFAPYPYVPYYHHHMPPPPPHYIAHVPPPVPVFYQVPDPPLNVKLQTQIHYYFSEPNLIKDSYLRGLMDDQGFVPLRDIASFNRVRGLTSSIQQIVEALQDSPLVIVQGEKIRKRQNWQKWLLPKVSTPPEASSSANAVASGLGNLSLNQSSSSQLQPSNGVSDSQQQSSSGVDHVSNNNHEDSDGANH